VAPASKAVLITGCSSGIGEATARRLAKAGWPVYASARRVESIEHLAEDGCKLLQLDVTDVHTMRAAVGSVEQEHGAVGVLVNNAGYSQSGAIETLSAEQVQRQFQTNVFGVITMCQLVLPGMRAQRSGKIVNVSSMGANFTFPGGGLYHASKYALEAISDALRFEVKGFGIDVIVLQPGLILTRFGEAASASIDAATDGSRPQSGALADSGSQHGGDNAYARFNATIAKATRGVYENPLLARAGGPPEAVARTIERAISARRPRTRYRVTPSARLLIAQRKLVSDRVWDRMMRLQFPQPR
jgi:NAD(P)-dependent dehydrogenase (short-subunit alcohol dehydrogenase family)